VTGGRIRVRTRTSNVQERFRGSGLTGSDLRNNRPIKCVSVAGFAVESEVKDVIV